MAKRKVYIEPKRNSNLVMATALNLLLLTFFVALASLSTPDGQKTKMGLNSLIGGFGILPGGKSPLQRALGKDITPEISPLTKGPMDMNKLRATLAKGGILEGTGVEESQLGVTITLRANVLFEDNSDVLKSDARSKLNVLAATLGTLNNHVVIAGHTDSRPVEGPPFGSNWGLSSARAMAVMRHLAGKGIGYERMAAYGRGSQRPISSNANEAGRRVNNRVEITILGPLSGEAQDKAQGLSETPEQTPRTYQYKGFDFELKEL